MDSTDQPPHAAGPMTIRQLERLADLLEMWGDTDEEANRIRRDVETEIDRRLRATGHVNRRPNRPASHKTRSTTTQEV